MYNKIKYKKTFIFSTLLMLLTSNVFAQEAPVVGQSGNPFAKAPPPIPNNNQNNTQQSQPLTPEQEEAVRQIFLNLSPTMMNQPSMDMGMQNTEFKDPNTLYLEKNESIRGTLNGKYMIFNSETNDYRYESINKYTSVSIQKEEIEEESTNQDQIVK